MQVETALASRDTTLEQFIEGGRRQGKTFQEIYNDLTNVTGVPFHERTFYRWLSDLEAVA